MSKILLYFSDFSLMNLRAGNFYFLDWRGRRCLEICFYGEFKDFIFLGEVVHCSRLGCLFFFWIGLVGRSQSIFIWQSGLNFFCSWLIYSQLVDPLTLKISWDSLTRLCTSCLAQEVPCTGTVEMYFCIFIAVAAFVLVFCFFFAIFFTQNTNSFILLCIVTAKPHAVPIFIFLSFKLEFHYMVASLISLFSILEKLKISCYRKGV